VANLALDRTHVLTFNYIFDFPDFSRHLGLAQNPVGKVVLDGWQYSGLTTMSSGRPST
jgi:hypothetical protein